MNFKQIKWQKDIILSLKQNISNKTLRHAILFTGENGTSALLANATANALLCEKNTDDMCGTCPSCKKLIARSHPDKIIVEKKKNKQSFGVEEVRDMVSSMYIRPMYGKEKIYIFEDASALTPAAQNALLKVIEEPPVYGRIILCAKKEEDLLPTVLSRITHKYKLNPPETSEITEYLEQKYPEKRKIAGFCAAFSQGNPQLAEELITKDGAFSTRKRLCIFIDALSGNEKSVLFNFTGYLKEHNDEFTELSAYILAIFRDMLFVKLSLKNIINTDLLTEITEISKVWSAQKIQQASDRFVELTKAIRNSAGFESAVLNFLLETWEDLHD
ncbi:MAG: hypothetical protein IKJ06_04410 [Clostridia bacterium]|nr:hypothetical protein [Clostridia bacterium]